MGSDHSRHVLLRAESQLFRRGVELFGWQKCAPRAGASVERVCTHQWDTPIPCVRPPRQPGCARFEEGMIVHTVTAALGVGDTPESAAASAREVAVALPAGDVAVVWLDME